MLNQLLLTAVRPIIATRYQRIRVQAVHNTTNTTGHVALAWLVSSHQRDRLIIGVHQAHSRQRPRAVMRISEHYRYALNMAQIGQRTRRLCHIYGEHAIVLIVYAFQLQRLDRPESALHLAHPHRPRQIKYVIVSDRLDTIREQHLHLSTVCPLRPLECELQIPVTGVVRNVLIFLHIAGLGLYVLPVPIAMQLAHVVGSVHQIPGRENSPVARSGTILVERSTPCQPVAAQSARQRPATGHRKLNVTTGIHTTTCQCEAVSLPRRGASAQPIGYVGVNVEP